MKPRDIVLAYNFNHAKDICRINHLNFHKIIIFTHDGLFSAKKYFLREGENLVIKKLDNIEFQRKLEKLRGFGGTFIFYFKDKTEFEYTTDWLWRDIYTIFDKEIYEYLNTLDTQVQELYKISWMVR